MVMMNFWAYAALCFFSIRLCHGTSFYSQKLHRRYSQNSESPIVATSRVNFAPLQSSVGQVGSEGAEDNSTEVGIPPVSCYRYLRGHEVNYDDCDWAVQHMIYQSGPIMRNMKWGEDGDSRARTPRTYTRGRCSIKVKNDDRKATDIFNLLTVGATALRIANTCILGLPDSPVGGRSDIGNDKGFYVSVSAFPDGSSDEGPNSAEGIHLISLNQPLSQFTTALKARQLTSGTSGSMRTSSLRKRQATGNVGNENDGGIITKETVNVTASSGKPNSTDSGEEIDTTGAGEETDSYPPSDSDNEYALTTECINPNSLPSSLNQTIPALNINDCLHIIENIEPPSVFSNTSSEVEPIDTDNSTGNYYTLPFARHYKSCYVSFNTPANYERPKNYSLSPSQSNKTSSVPVNSSDLEPMVSPDTEASLTAMELFNAGLALFQSCIYNFSDETDVIQTNRTYGGVAVLRNVDTDPEFDPEATIIVTYSAYSGRTNGSAIPQVISATTVETLIEAEGYDLPTDDGDGGTGGPPIIIPPQNVTDGTGYDNSTTNEGSGTIINPTEGTRPSILPTVRPVGGDGNP